MTIGFRGGDLTPAGASEGRAWRGQKEGWQSALENVVVSTYHRHISQANRSNKRCSHQGMLAAY